MLVKPGSVTRLEVPVARLPPGAWTSMPAVIIHGQAPGPTVWLSGTIHGDELNGVGIIRALIEQIDPDALAGTVIAVPIVNVFGVVQGSRYLPDRRDLNRSFPGSRRGSLASRLAHLFFDTVVRRCQFGIDFHTGSNGRSNLPHIRCDINDADTRRLAEAFGCPVILHAGLRDGSLRAAAAEAEICSLVYEAGEALRFGRRAVATGVEGTLRVFAALRMLRGAPEPAAEPPMICRKSAWVRAHRSGFCQRKVRLGERVDMGQVVAEVVDSVGKSRAVTRAKHAGVVIGCLKTALVHRGDALVHIARHGSILPAEG
jgi:uncharacterized protein